METAIFHPMLDRNQTGLAKAVVEAPPGTEEETSGLTLNK